MVFVVKFIHSLVRQFEGIPVLVACEDRPQGLADHVAEGCSAFRKDGVFFLNGLFSNNADKTGVNIGGPFNKDRLEAYFSRLLKKGTFHFAKSILCQTNLEPRLKGDDFGDLTSFLKEKLLRELGNVQFDEKTQKTSGKHNGMQDDFFSAFILASYVEVLRDDPRTRIYTAKTAPVEDYLKMVRSSH